jgi:hypothetical protein
MNPWVEKCTPSGCGRCLLGIEHNAARARGDVFWEVTYFGSVWEVNRASGLVSRRSRSIRERRSIGGRRSPFDWRLNLQTPLERHDVRQLRLAVSL